MSSDDAESSSKLRDLLSKFDVENPCPRSLEKIKELCGDYLGGSWVNVGNKEFTVKPILGGLTNFLYLVELNEFVKTIGDEPKRALLRIYSLDDAQQRLVESVVFSVFSERSLGPKLLGVFPGGRFEDFLPSQTLKFQDINDPRYYCKVAEILAQFHCLNVPIKKKAEMVNSFRKWLNSYRNFSQSADLDLTMAKDMVDESEFPTSLSCDDIAKEIQYVEKFLEKCGSPLVFSHNDIHGGNILLLDNFTINDDGSVLHNGEPTSEEPMVMIDFEFCNYNYRGFDIGNLFCELGFDYFYEKSPYFRIIPEYLDNPITRRKFCEAYLDEIYKLSSTGKVPANFVTGDRDADLHQLLAEAEIFMYISHFHWSIFTANASKDPALAGIQLDFGYAAGVRMAIYLANKSKLEEYLNTYGAR